MPSSLRAQVALIGLLAVLLIPIGTSSLRGLTHILTCRDKSATPFSVEVPESGPPIISSSTVIERDPSGAVESNEICGGLTLDLEIGSRAEDRADVTLLITNNTGPAHIAAAMDTPVVDLYALTNPQHTPWALTSRMKILNRPVPCAYCYRSVCPEGHHQCLRGVPPAEVVRAALDLLMTSPSDRACRPSTS